MVDCNSTTPLATNVALGVYIYYDSWDKPLNLYTHSLKNKHIEVILMKKILLILILLIPLSVYGAELSVETTDAEPTLINVDTQKSFSCGQYESRSYMKDKTNNKYHGIMMNKMAYQRNMHSKDIMDKGGYKKKMTYGTAHGMFGLGVLKLIGFALISFIFSVIFWLTHNWLVKKKR